MTAVLRGRRFAFSETEAAAETETGGADRSRAGGTVAA
jgi:hypothetical protein